jgi:hypothetical protein
MTNEKSRIDDDEIEEMIFIELKDMQKQIETNRSMIELTQAYLNDLRLEVIDMKNKIWELED